MSDARRYAVWPKPRSRSRSLKGSRPSVPHGTNFWQTLSWYAWLLNAWIVSHITSVVRVATLPENTLATEQARCFPLRGWLWKDYRWCDQLTADEVRYSLKFQYWLMCLWRMYLPGWTGGRQHDHILRQHAQFVVHRSMDGLAIADGAVLGLPPYRCRLRTYMSCKFWVGKYCWWWTTSFSRTTRRYLRNPFTHVITFNQCLF